MKSIYLCCYFLVLTFSLSAQFQVEGLLHIQNNAAVYVWDNIIINTANGNVDNSGTIEIEGNWTLNPSSSYNGNAGGTGARKVNFKNDNHNITGNQTITGAMTGSNAFYELEVSNTGTNGVVELANNIEVLGKLSLTEGRLRTDIIGHSTNGMLYNYEVYVTNPTIAAVTGHSMTSATGKYVEGRLRRNINGIGSYDFPVGTVPTMLDGSEPFSINFTSAAPASNLIAFYQDATTTATGNTTLCDINGDGSDDNVTIDCVFGQWNIVASSAGYNYDITLFPGANLQAFCPDAEQFFVSKDGATELCPDMDGLAGIKRTGLTDFGVFDIATASLASIVLPVELLNFTVNTIDNKIALLDWATALEVNTKLFDIERSFNGVDFSPIGTVLANGNTQETQVYHFEDSNLPTGIIYYRLRIVDNDGSEELSVIRSVHIDKGSELIQVYPNPFEEVLTVIPNTRGQEWTVYIYNSLGQLVFDKKISDTNTPSSFNINTASFQQGIYHIGIASNNGIEPIGSFIKQ